MKNIIVKKFALTLDIDGVAVSTNDIVFGQKIFNRHINTTFRSDEKKEAYIECLLKNIWEVPADTDPLESACIANGFILTKSKSKFRKIALADGNVFTPTMNVLLNNKILIPFGGIIYKDHADTEIVRTLEPDGSWSMAVASYAVVFKS